MFSDSIFKDNKDKKSIERLDANMYTTWIPSLRVSYLRRIFSFNV